MWSSIFPVFFMMILIEITGVMAHSSGINNSISFFLCSSAFEKSIFAHFALVALYIWPHYVQMDFEKKEKEQNPAVDFHQNICQQTQRWAERENTEVFQTPAQQH